MVAYVYLYIGYVKYIYNICYETVFYSSFDLLLTYLQTVHIFTLCSTPKASRPLESQINNKWTHFTASISCPRIPNVKPSALRDTKMMWFVWLFGSPPAQYVGGAHPVPHEQRGLMLI